MTEFTALASLPALPVGRDGYRTAVLNDFADGITPATVSASRSFDEVAKLNRWLYEIAPTCRDREEALFGVTDGRQVSPYDNGRMFLEKTYPGHLHPLYRLPETRPVRPHTSGA